jgi:hypothetical protein
MLYTGCYNRLELPTSVCELKEGSLGRTEKIHVKYQSGYSVSRPKLKTSSPACKLVAILLQIRSCLDA